MTWFWEIDDDASLLVTRMLNQLLAVIPIGKTRSGGHEGLAMERKRHLLATASLVVLSPSNRLRCTRLPLPTSLLSP